MHSRSKHLLLLIGTAWLFDAMDVALLSFIMPLLKAEWHLNDGTLGLVSAITAVGMAVGAALAGRLADSLGRRTVLMATLILFSLGNLALIIAPNVGTFLVIRFLTGIGLGGELPVAATLLADHFSGTKRSQMLILVDSFWAYGWLIASLISWTLMPRFGWRIAAIITGLAGLYVLILRRHLPADQPRIVSSRTPFHSFWHSRFRRPLVILSLLWFIVMLTYYGMFMWLPSVLVMRGFSIVHSMGYSLVMTLAQLPGYYLAAYLMQHLARKTILALYLGGTILASLAFAAANTPVLILLAGGALSFFDLGAWGVLIALTPSQFPSELRGTGMGTAQSIGRIGAVIGPFMVGWLFNGGAGILTVFAIFVGLLLVGLFVLVFGISDQSIEDHQKEANQGV